MMFFLVGLASSLISGIVASVIGYMIGAKSTAICFYRALHGTEDVHCRLGKLKEQISLVLKEGENGKVH